MNRNYLRRTKTVLKRSSTSYPTTVYDTSDALVTSKEVISYSVVYAFAKSKTIQQQDSQIFQIDKRCVSNSDTSITIFN